MTVFDPLDLEILERAFECARNTVRDAELSIEVDTDEELETALRCELIEIACSRGITDPETLRDLVLARLCSEEIGSSTR
jgi:hypothetical protein